MREAVYFMHVFVIQYKHVVLVLESHLFPL
jgi:hypothetical protein